MGSNGICWIKNEKRGGPEVNAPGYCALPTAHPRLTWLCVTYPAIHSIPTITLAARRMQYVKLLSQSCFPAYSYSFHS